MAASNDSERRLLWKPRVAATATDRFRAFVNSRHRANLKDYADLHAYSVGEKTADDFWVDLFLFLEIKSDRRPTVSISAKDRRLMFPPPSFFPEVRLNIVENMLSGRDPNAVAIHTCGEGITNLKDITWGTLQSEVQRVADAMISSGVRTDDRVAGILSNRLETVVACLATISIGALWSTTSPDMGVDGILDRLLQIRPKLLFAEKAVFYNGKLRDLMPKNRECAKIMSKMQDFQNIILLSHDGAMREDPEIKLISWDLFLERGVGRELHFKQLPFHHPGLIVYSSGTTGPPKCIVHSAGGMLLQIKKDLVLHTSVGPSDVLFQYTSTSWIMWAFALCGLSTGGSVVLYDGSPLRPDPLVLLRLIAKLKITMFGTSARFLSDLKSSGLKPRELIDLSSLRTVTSTGSTLTADVCNWFYDHGFPSDIHLISMSGGTDMACSLVTGSPTLPVYSGEIQCDSLGMAVDIVDNTSSTVVSIKETGEPGELVCLQPFPSQPVMFWGENGMKRYQSSYFERFGNRVWCQGDFVMVVPDTKGILMLGRSDGVLNPSGVRFGSAEIYAIVEKIPDIDDSICVGQRRPQDNDEAVVLFVKMKPSSRLTRQLREEIKKAIREARSPRHVPKYIFEITEIPYTVNGKKIELAVKQIVSGQPLKPNGAVANPASFASYQRFFDIEKADQADLAAKL